MSMEPGERGGKRGTWRSILVWLFALIALVPFVQMFYVAQKPRHLVDDAYYHLSQARQLPESEVRRKIEVDARPLRRAAVNSIAVSTVCSLLCVPTCLMAGYAFARRRFRGKGFLFTLVLLSLAVPPAILMMPIFRLAVGLRIYDTLLALILPFSVSGMGIVYMRWAISSVPESVLDAARLDGLSEAGILFRIVVPAIWPSVGTLAVLQFIVSWNAFVLPDVLVQSQENYTVAVLLGRLMTEFRNLMWNDVMVVVTAGVLPMLVLFAVFHRWVLAGLTAIGDERPKEA